MKKIFLIAVMFMFASTVYATQMVRIVKLDGGSVSVKTPDGETETYRDIEDIPELLYGSRITAGGAPVEIQFFNTALIILNKNQSIFISKNPVTKEIEVVKYEAKSKQNGIKVLLAGNISATFGSDTKVTFYEQFPSIFFGVKYGNATVNGLDGRIYKLVDGDHYEAKQNLLE